MAPWSAFWERNFFAGLLPFVERLAASPFVRGGVSGIGAVTAAAGLAELAGLFGARGGSRPQPEPGRSVEAR